MRPIAINSRQNPRFRRGEGGVGWKGGPLWSPGGGETAVIDAPAPQVHNQETIVGMGDITHILFPGYALAQAVIQPQQVIQLRQPRQVRQTIQTSLEMHQATRGG